MTHVTLPSDHIEIASEWECLRASLKANFDIQNCCLLSRKTTVYHTSLLLSHPLSPCLTLAIFAFLFGFTRVFLRELLCPLLKLS